MRKAITLYGPAFLFILAWGSSCHRKPSFTDFSYHPLGYYYKLISFDSDSSGFQRNKIAWVAASFKTQSDSVFWDSHNNLNDKFYIELDSASSDNFVASYISTCSALDSACILIRPSDFFRQQFKTMEVPFFSRHDTVVKVNLKIKRLLSRHEFLEIRHNLEAKENAQIKRYFGTQAEMDAAKDVQGFYWVDLSEGSGKDTPREGDQVSIAYQGSYLNGRFLERSGGDFEFIYGTPDQVLKGINYVIGRLKLGGNAKIILPSRLAFGEIGSSNGTVPPYTPLVYEIKLTKLKTNKNIPG